MTELQDIVVGQPRATRDDNVTIHADIADGPVVNSASGPFTFRLALVTLEWSRRNMGPWRWVCTVTGPRILKSGEGSEFLRGELAYDHRSGAPDWLKPFIEANHPDTVYSTTDDQDQ